MSGAGVLCLGLGSASTQWLHALGIEPYTKGRSHRRIFCPKKIKIFQTCFARFFLFYFQIFLSPPQKKNIGMQSVPDIFPSVKISKLLEIYPVLPVFLGDRKEAILEEKKLIKKGSNPYPRPPAEFLGTKM